MPAGAVRVRVPASTANLGPGFDALGMALNLYARIEMAAAEQTQIELLGTNMQGIPTDKTNLIYKVARMLYDEAGISMPELNIRMDSEIPLTRGLGSSASAIVGALAAANALSGAALPPEELFRLASSLEKHPDNVGASLFGGIIAAYWDGSEAKHIRIEPHERLEALVAVPAFQLSTEHARGVLPSEVPMKDAVYNIGHTAVLVAALAAGDLGMIRHAMKDALHQPYRAALVPGMEKVLREAADHGALGAALSGAGPTLIAFADAQEGRKEELETFLRKTFLAEGIEADTRWLKPSGEGVRVWTMQGGEPAFEQFVEGAE
ncbi:homoserine kinase [Paenibacillus lutrae]|uniref:Homoserine kinase n=1 Tax=Paenibacillus lutrae TaxID=2078573 RepID=A0A7X3JYZ7_9BACL|nr:homoserine kinase [Paenibacillus lutrae]MVO99663.1 homoserine kinase [Paenibacillus lutrae]